MDGLTGPPHVLPHPHEMRLAWGDQMHCLEFASPERSSSVSPLLSPRLGVKPLFDSRVPLDLGRGGVRWGRGGGIRERIIKAPVG